MSVFFVIVAPVSRSFFGRMNSTFTTSRFIRSMRGVIAIFLVEGGATSFFITTVGVEGGIPVVGVVGEGGVVGMPEDPPPQPPPPETTTTGTKYIPASRVRLLSPETSVYPLELRVMGLILESVVPVEMVP